jgi:hypothetical protein
MSLYDAICSKTLEVDMAAARSHPSPSSGPAICMRLIISFSLTMLGETKKRPFLASECDSLQGKNISSNECKHHPLKELCLSCRLLAVHSLFVFQTWTSSLRISLYVISLQSMHFMHIKSFI